MEQFNLAGSNTKLLIKDNVLAILSDKSLMTVSSAIFNGGFKKVKAVLNVGVPEGYNDRSLHLDPLNLITSSAAKLGLTEDYLAMVTAAKIKNYSLVSKTAGIFSVSVAATAGCSHGESSGEEMAVQEIAGTINIIVLIDGNPTESCMVASLITATEAKSAALRDFDVRSRYTGDSATGSITDSVTIASTSQGKTINYGGPASKLGKLVGYCTRRAVTEALIKQEPIWACRTVLDRLKERHLPLEKLAAELSKVDSLAVDEKALADILKNKPLATTYLLAAARLDDDFKKNLLLAEFGDISDLSRCFGIGASSKKICSDVSKYDSVDLPPFLKHALINIVREALDKGSTEKT
ncbi:MAG: adenosylcobinamide amidohydrolase [Candidatus Bathyarchaeia archaeon]|jgi:adenosylcobinamide amidohydrolase